VEENFYREGLLFWTCLLSCLYPQTCFIRFIWCGTSSLTWWVKSRFGQNPIAQFSPKKLRNHLQVRHLGLRFTVLRDRSRNRSDVSNQSWLKLSTQ